MMSGRQFRIALVVMLFGSVTGGAVTTWLLPGRAAWAQGSGMQEVVKARSFLLLDESGNTRAKLGTAEDGSVGLFVLDAAGKRRAQLCVLAEGPHYVFRDGNLVESNAPDAVGPVAGTPVLSLRGGDKLTSIASMSVDEDGPDMMLLRADPRLREAMMEVTEEGPSLALTDTGPPPRFWTAPLRVGP